VCGISGIFGRGWNREDLQSMVTVQHHRGPDDEGLWIDPSGIGGLGHNRLSIIDLSSAGHQPMANHNETLRIVFNGEIYNYVELRRELKDYPYRSNSDTEVILAAYEKWGAACLDRFVGMFSLAIWDSASQRLFAARDRFGVKPLNYCLTPEGTLYLASEIKALRSIRNLSPDPVAWATFFNSGALDYSDRTFWEGVRALAPGHFLEWQSGRITIKRWYDVADRISHEYDTRTVDIVQEEYLALMEESIRLRFRADVPVGINLSGGLDSSTLLGLVQKVQGAESNVKAFTFVTGDDNYDELPWVQQMLSHTQHPSIVCALKPSEVPDLAASVQEHQDEPFGGLPTLAYARVFEEARARGTIVLLDGQGIDEQWAGYDYYARAMNGGGASLVQGTKDAPVRPECMIGDFRSAAEPLNPSQPFPDVLRNLQYRDIRYTKIPRALRYNDRISMRSSTEMREPFLDHRLFELALRQSPERKIVNGTRKWLVREIARKLLPGSVVEAPKRPLQTPQREWLRGPLRTWAHDCIEEALAHFGGTWLDRAAVRATWQAFYTTEAENSYYIWQWVCLGLVCQNLQVTTSSYE
jgi:asparagine synthase (glutamine-hydrolysing)